MLTLDSPSEIFFTSDGGCDTIRFMSNDTWDASSSVSWIHIVPEKGESSEPVIIVLNCDSNTSVDERTAVITISAGNMTKKIKVKQAYDPFYKLGTIYKLGTLPILYIYTENESEILSKEEYVNAKYWLKDIEGGKGSLGSANAPLDMLIKGRGNATWRASEKKPYRIKLSEKQSLLGMNPNKHFVLLSGIDDNRITFLNYPLAFEYSRRIGLGWTPELRQVEVILNGDYRGLYFLVEKIRIDKDRINIKEQKDGEEDPQKVTGGWLLEFDNTEDPQQLIFAEGNGNELAVKYHSPDSLSDKQRAYLQWLMEKCNECIYTKDKTNNEWEEYVDVESLAKFYIVQEVMGHREAFMGSTYLYKDRGENEKLKFGPLWDMGNWVLLGNYEHFIYENTPYTDKIHWIEEIAKFPHFQEVVRKIWGSFRYKLDTSALEEEVVAKLETAAENNFIRWPEEGWTGSLLNGKKRFDEAKEAKRLFLESVWGVSTSNPNKSNE